MMTNLDDARDRVNFLCKQNLLIETNHWSSQINISWPLPYPYENPIGNVHVVIAWGGSVANLMLCSKFLVDMPLVPVNVSRVSNLAVKGGSLKGESSSTHQPHLPHPMESLRWPSATAKDKVSSSRNCAI